MRVMNLVEGLHNFLEFSSPLECLYQVIQTQGKVFHCFYQINFQNKKRKTLCYGTDQKEKFLPVEKSCTRSLYVY